MLVDKNTFQLGEWIVIYSLYINLTRLAKRGRKMSLLKHLAVASSEAESEQVWAFQKVFSSTSYRASPPPLVSDLYPHSLDPQPSGVTPSFPWFTVTQACGRKTGASILQSDCLFCTSYAENTIWETPKHYFRGANLSYRWNYGTGFVWEFLLLLWSTN